MKVARSCLILSLFLVLALAQDNGQIFERYQEVAGRLIGAAMVDESGWAKLKYLCDRIGNRLSGSAAPERAVDWASQQMRQDGLLNVVTPAVKVPHWVRGNESIEVLEPVQRSLPMLGLGGSVGTPSAGITADVVAVSSFEELEKLPRSQIRGRIILYDVPFEGYGQTVVYRRDGPSRAAALGAVAVLIRSIGPISLQTPHTGSLGYDDAAPRIPAAALSIEGATLLHRLAESGQRVRVRLAMEAQMLPDADSANVIGEIPGREFPNQVVVMGGHLDSWDVGQGAHDDGAGCIAALQAAALIQQLGLRPRRTIRVVLWTNEENGLAGGRAYREWVGERISDHVAAIEMDGGAEQPIGFGMAVPPGNPAFERAFQNVQGIGRLLQGIGAGGMFRGGGGADIGPLMQDGVPGFGLRTVGEHYFDWHHTEADTLDKIDPQNFKKNVAAMAVLAFILADMPSRLIE